MNMFGRDITIVVYFTVYVFRLSGQLKPSKVRGYIQIIDIAEYVGRFELVLYFFQFLLAHKFPFQYLKLLADSRLGLFQCCRQRACR